MYIKYPRLHLWRLCQAPLPDRHLDRTVRRETSESRRDYAKKRFELRLGGTVIKFSTFNVFSIRLFSVSWFFLRVSRSGSFQVPPPPPNTVFKFYINVSLSRFTRMVNFPTISMVMMKTTQVGCDLYVVLATKTNRTWSYFSMATISTTEQCETSPRELSFSCGIIITIPSSLECRSVYAMSPDVRANRTRKRLHKRYVLWPYTSATSPPVII